jgi:hypothetical protein
VGRPFRTPWVARDGADRFVLDLPPGLEAALVQLGGEVRELLGSDEPAVRRVFPTAYADDPEREAGYQALVRGELIERHQAGLDLIASTIEAEALTTEQVTAWMTTVNAIRLILGTALDVSEDLDLELDESDPRYPVHQLFVVLGVLLHDIVDALDSR